MIRDGEVIMGVVDKKTVGNSAGGLIHITWLDKGWAETARFMIQVQQVSSSGSGGGGSSRSGRRRRCVICCGMEQLY